MICGVEVSVISKLACVWSYPETFSVTVKHSCNLNFIACHRGEIEE